VRGERRKSNFPSIFGLGEWQGDMVVAGNFTQIGSPATPATPANGVAGRARCAADCPPDLKGDGELDGLDFVAFQTAFQSQDPIADCNNDSEFTVFDFVCFQQLFAAGCP